MSTNADLASWDETPASAAEEGLAEFLSEMLQALRDGSTSETATETLAVTQLLSETSRNLVETMGLLERLAGAVPAPENRTPPLPDCLPDPFPGEFRIREFLAEGAYGRVWLADDLQIPGRQVALKMLKPPHEARKEILAAIRHEAELLNSVRHPNVVDIYSVRQSGEDCYLVLQYFSGGSLKARLQEEGCLPWQRACRYVADVGEALVHVHRQGIIHRDIKPANILWNCDTDEAVLTDFGISCRLAKPEAAAGTLPYLSPEALEGRIAPAIDVFALAATLFHLTTGDVPFPATNVIEYLDRARAGLSTSDSRLNAMPLPVGDLVRQGLTALPDQRPSLDEFVSMLRGTLNRLMADYMCAPVGESSTPAPVDLRINVSRDANGLTSVDFPSDRDRARRLSSQPASASFVPDRIPLHTGERIRIQVSVNRSGYVILFNIGPTGNLHLLWPEGGPASWVDAGRGIDELSVKVTPPRGRERLVAAWSRQPLPIGEVLRLTGKTHAAVSGPYLATRDLERVEDSVRRLGPEDWHAVVLELDHEN
jgi:serine/threonine protein kinase